MADELTEQIPGFEILEKVAEGGMGAVYKARQLSLDRIVAIKVLPARLASDAQFVRRFQEESRTAAKLKHPHLIEVYDAGQFDGKHYFVMEYVEGETVGTKLFRDGPFVERTAIGICLNVVQALQYAWDKAKLLHGDIKPENLILEKDSKKVRIADLGLGKSLLNRAEDGKAEEHHHSMGTPSYVCPELARGEKLEDFRGDMYALGATLYHMLTGKIPFDGMTPAEILAGHLQGTLPDPRTYRSYLSESAVIVLERMMARDPKDRYPSWATLVHDLSQVHSNLSPSMPPLPPGKSTVARQLTPTAQVGKKKISPLRLALELVVVTLIVVGIWYYKYRWLPAHRPAESSELVPTETTTPAQPAQPSQQVQPSLPKPAETPQVESPEERARKEAEARRLEEERKRKETQQRALEAQSKTEAEQRFVSWHNGFESMLAGGDFTKAKESAVALQNDPAMRFVKEQVAQHVRVADLLLRLRDTARTNLLGQTYFVGATSGTVFKIDANKFWVKLAAGEVALNLDSIDPAKIPTLALSKNREDLDLNLGAGLYCWYRGEKELAKTYFALAGKSGTDISAYLPGAMPSGAPTPPASGETPEETAPAPERPARDDGANMLANPRFERWSGKTLLDWSTSSGAVRPAQDLTVTQDGNPSVRFDCDYGQDSFSLEQPFHVIVGHNYRLTLHYRTQGFEGKLWVETGPPGDPSPSLKQQLESASDWQGVTIEFAAASTGTIVLRAKANGAKGTVWLDNFDLRLVGK